MMMGGSTLRSFLSFAACLILMVHVSGSQGLQCLDAREHPVDWFAIYKAPKVHHPKGPRFHEGLAYYYLDVHSPQFSLAPNAVNATDTAVDNTLQQIYKGKFGTFMYLMYNDEPPPHASQANALGHTKGVVAFDGQQGFWLVHSCPKFPPMKSEGYRWKSQDYGQNLLCMTFPYKELGNIATQLLYNEPHSYDWDFPAQFRHDFPILDMVVKRKHVKHPPWFHVAKLTSSGGQTFTSFAKGRKFGADLYDDLVAPTLASDLMVETWLRPSGTELPSNCTAKYKVYRVNAIALPNDLKFSETKDHSKWAITAPRETSQLPPSNSLRFQPRSTLAQLIYKMIHPNSAPAQPDSTPWTCIGDINRMKSQFKRGGGTVCLQNSAVWKSYNATVAKFGKCP